MSKFLNNKSTRKPTFEGPFTTWRTSLSTNRELGTQDGLLVFSSGKREAVKEYLWLKLVWSQLSKLEFLLFISTLNLNEERKWAFLRMQQIYPKSIIRERLNKIESLFNLPVSSQVRLSGYYRLRIEIHKETRSLPKIPKYSGYTRSPSSVGSKHSSVRQFLDEMVIQDDVFSEKELLDWDYLLSVDTVSLFLGRLIGGS